MPWFAASASSEATAWLVCRQINRSHDPAKVSLHALITDVQGHLWLLSDATDHISRFTDISLFCTLMCLLRPASCHGNHWAGLQSHGREVDEEGWNSSGADSEGVQRSAHSTPHATSLPRGPFAPAAQPDGEGKEELQVASRSRSAFIPRRLKQVPPLCHAKDQ